MKFKYFLPLAAVLALAACEVPSKEQRAKLDSMIGKSSVDVVRAYGVPSRTYLTGGHAFLAYIDNETNYYPGTGGWGWGWGGPGWGGGWGGRGFGGGWGGGGWGGGWGGAGFGPSVYSSTCQTTFEMVNGLVTGWTMRGDGC